MLLRIPNIFVLTVETNDMQYSYLCMNGKCPEFMKEVKGKYHPGQQVEVPDGRIGTITTMKCDGCNDHLQCMTPEEDWEGKTKVDDLG